MMSVVHIWPDRPVRRDGFLIASAAIETPGSDRCVIWYSFPESYEDSLNPSADPFIVGSIHKLMQSGHPVHVHGAVSPSLLRNLDEYQAAWTSWMPNLKRVTIHGDQEREIIPPEPREDAVVAFSGGVDSCFTAFRHARSTGLQRPYRPTAGVMVHGFDIPLEETTVFASASARSKKMLSSLGLDLIPVATNYRELVSDWSHSFGAAISSCLMLLSFRFQIGLIGQGLTYKEYHLLREGSNPLTDSMCSSNSFKIVPDGAEFDRASKIYTMKDWPEFSQHLRVCWQGPAKDQNCCMCEKCVRNILTFRALGLGLPSCFPLDVTDKAIERLGLGPGALPEIRYAGLADLAKEHGVAGNWSKLVERRLAYTRRSRQINRVRNFARRTFRRFLGTQKLKEHSASVGSDRAQ